MFSIDQAKRFKLSTELMHEYRLVIVAIKDNRKGGNSNTPEIRGRCTQEGNLKALEQQSFYSRDVLGKKTMTSGFTLPNML